MGHNVHIFGSKEGVKQRQRNCGLLTILLDLFVEIADINGLVRSDC